MSVRQVTHCAVPLGSSEVDCECMHCCVGTSDCQSTVNVDTLTPNTTIVHGTQ